MVITLDYVDLDVITSLCTRETRKSKLQRGDISEARGWAQAVWKLEKARKQSLP